MAPKGVFIILSLFFSSALMPLEFVCADSLNDVMSSRLMSKVSRETRIAQRARVTNNHERDSDARLLAGIDPSSNFAEVFTQAGGPVVLINWVGANLTKFKLNVTRKLRRHDLAYVTAVFSGDRGESITMDIYVPHPSFASLVQLRTMREFNQFEPPTLKTKADEKVIVNNNDGVFYHSADDKCSVLFKLPKDSILNLKTSKCEFSNTVMEIARNLDINRLKKKLET